MDILKLIEKILNDKDCKIWQIKSNSMMYKNGTVRISKEFKNKC